VQELLVSIVSCLAPVISRAIARYFTVTRNAELSLFRCLRYLEEFVVAIVGFLFSGRIQNMGVALDDSVMLVGL